MLPQPERMLFLLILTSLTSASNETGGMLYPRASESRELLSLDGIWNFRIGSHWDPEEGFRERWFAARLPETGPVEPMPVPSSYNDITQNSSIRDFVGWVWYDREFFVPKRWQIDQQRVVLRFGSVHYAAQVWVNGIPAVNHTGGHLPFETEISSLLRFNRSNTLTVAVNNTLTPYTIPQGMTVTHPNDTRYPDGYYAQQYSFDFFNYAGIHRSVQIYTTPQTYIDDITTVTSFTDDGDIDGVIYYKIDYKTASESNKVTCFVKVYDKNRNLVGSEKGCEHWVTISNATLWWPYQMDPNPGYMYTFKVKVKTSNKLDVYRLPVGIRTISFSKTEIFINNKPFYFRGFGRHEDFHIRGKGLDLPLIVKDYNLIKWVGANSFRTSHYPYAEEIMDQADQQGIVIIDECPAVSLSIFDEEMLANHMQVMSELVRRDKNRPSVILWSVANEPQSYKEEAKEYFSNLTNYVRSLDTSRMVSLVINAAIGKDHAAPSVDIICVNRYFSWYSDTGHLELVTRQAVNEFTEWHKVHSKPVMITEYGADTIPGMHMDPVFVWTEDYQVAMMSEYFKAFDELRSLGFFVGEMIWNFADFATAQEMYRVAGNKKGIFTRERQPKASAHLLRARYHDLAQKIDEHYDNDYRNFQMYCPRT